MTHLVEETSATAAEQDLTRDASTVNPALIGSVRIWRPGLVVAGAVLAAALAQGRAEPNYLAGSSRRRNEAEYSESNTAVTECDPELFDQVQTLFDHGASEFFQDGLNSQFSRSLISLLATHRGAALQAVAQYLFTGSAKPDVKSEALRWIAEYRDSATAHESLRILRRSLLDSSPRVRDGAILGLASIDDPRALPLLREARQAEGVAELGRLIDSVVEQLIATANAASTANGQAEPLV
mgnify:CR=1 FL=1